MKIALICPSNILYMPYIKNYEKALKHYNFDYDILNWDRLHIEIESYITYKDNKHGISRSVIDYYKYSRFIKKNIKSKDYDYIVVFGIQLGITLKKILNHRYKNKYIFDIRDYHPSIRFINISHIVSHSIITVISSPAFKEWLPISDKYIINHNSGFKQISALCEKPKIGLGSKSKVVISYIGALRDYDVNIGFIESLKNNDNYELRYHGEGVISKELSIFAKTYGILNILLTGKYNQEEEEELYQNSDLVNILLPTNTLNSKTLLPNRLYNAIYYCKPILTSKGTYLAKLVHDYKIGIVIENFIDIDTQIVNYFTNFNVSDYVSGRKRLLEQIEFDNNLFDNTLYLSFTNKTSTTQRKN